MRTSDDGRGDARRRDRSRGRGSTPFHRTARAGTGPVRRTAPALAAACALALSGACATDDAPPAADVFVTPGPLAPADDAATVTSAPSPIPAPSPTPGGERDATSAGSTAPAAIEPRAAPRSARLRSTRLRETSGLAVSRRDAEVLWAINDSGNAPLLHALTRRGKRLGEWPVTVERARDWEDLAAFALDGVPHLAIADTGDNLRGHDDYVLHLVAEPAARGPDAAPGTALAPSRSIRFRLEDGSHDVESLGIDADGATAWLLVKAAARRGGTSAGGGVYALSLAAPDARAVDTAAAGGSAGRSATSGVAVSGGPAADDPPDRRATPGEAPPGDPAPAPSDTLRIARRVGTLAAVPRSLEARLAARLAGVDLEQPTAFDIAPDGRAACLLTYRRVRCFRRGASEDWGAVLSRPGRVLATHDLGQAEALALSADGLVWFTSEGVLPPLRTLPLRAVSP